MTVLLMIIIMIGVMIINLLLDCHHVTGSVSVFYLHYLCKTSVKSCFSSFADDLSEAQRGQVLPSGNQNWQPELVTLTFYSRICAVLCRDELPLQD